MPPLEWGGIIALAGIVFHAGMLSERMRQLRKDHEALTVYAHAISHTTIERMTREIDRIKKFLYQRFPDSGDQL